MEDRLLQPAPRPFVALVKFFRDQRHLSAFMDGTLYCNTPEHYRLSNEEGVSDHDESCALSYRESRGDKPLELQLDGHAIDGIQSLSLHADTIRDAWLHCWVALEIPKTEQDLLRQIEDLNRIRREFGTSYVVLPHPKVMEFVAIVTRTTEHPVWHGQVRYSDKRIEWGPRCKSTRYSYQREYRFLVGQCPESSTEALVLRHSPGFRGLLMENAPLEMTYKDSRNVLLRLSPEECSRGVDQSTGAMASEPNG